MWFLLKFLLSSLLVCFSGAAVYFSIRDGQLEGIGGASVVLFLAALPWASMQPRSRSFALAGIVFSLGLLGGSVLRYGGSFSFPQSCTERGWTWCQLENGLYAFGGNGLLLLASIGVAIVLLAASLYGALKYPSRPADGPPQGKLNA